MRITDHYPFPKLPPAPRGNRIALGAVALLALAFAVYFVAFTWAKHNAYQTFAEDMGIMDQALWNLVHGYGLRQTICNPIGDTNCLGDVSRLAIHFEPIMYVIGLFYLVAPSPKTLQLIQTVVVAAGAFPAYGIASRRLRSALAGVVFAAVYLLFPALQAAVTYDFHAVTLSAAFLMFALYFMLTRNNVGLVIACLLAMSTKENIPLDVLMIGASVALLQRRWRIGLALCAVALIWLGVELPIMHAASPVGYSPTAGRYAYLGSSPLKIVGSLLTHPLQVIREHVLDPGGRYYLRSLLSPTAYLAPLGPFALLLAVPAIAINILSTNPSQRSGLYHYNAEIVPFLVFATIEAVWWIAALVGWIGRQAEQQGSVRAVLSAPVARVEQGYARAMQALPQRLAAVLPSQGGFSLSALARWLATMALVALTLLFSLHEQNTRGYLPFTQDFAWPQQTAHTQLAERFLQMIPAQASVSAQSELVPHISQRRFIYQFPFADSSADYDLLDITASPYPYDTTAEYFTELRRLLTGGQYSVVAAQDGYLLLRRGSGPTLNPANPYGLPAALFTFDEQPASAPIPHPMQAQFGPSLRLVGYDITPDTHPIAQTYISVTTYWQVTGAGPVSAQDQFQLLLTRQDSTYAGISTFAATALQPLSAWRPGVTYVVQAPIYVTARDAGRDVLSMRVQSGPGQSAADFLHVTLTPLGKAGPVAATTSFPAMDPDQNQAIFAAITVE